MMREQIVLKMPSLCNKIVTIGEKLGFFKKGWDVRSQVLRVCEDRW